MHVKVWRLAEDVRIDEGIAFSYGLNVVHSAVSEDFNTAVFVAREYARVRWSEDDPLSDVSNHLFVIHHNREQRFLFICASKRQDGTHQRLCEAITGRSLRNLPFDTLNRVLLGLENMSDDRQRRCWIGGATRPSRRSRDALRASQQEIAFVIGDIAI